VEIFIDGDRVEAEDGQTVMQAARASGHVIPFFCWHPALSVPGNCRICMVEIQGDGTAAGWLDIACNMPVAKGMRVLTDSPRVRARRKQMLELVTLNHPVDCGICDKAGECTLQDYHYEYNGAPSVSREIPVGALLSRPFLHKARVWYLEATPSVCPGCERGCSIDVWHRKSEWKLNRLDPAANARIDRVTPRENPAVNGPWICNKGRDLAQIFERPRATTAMILGSAVELEAAVEQAGALIAAAGRPAALVSSWGSNEELA